VNTTIDRLNNVIEYIEQNLKEELSFDKLADIYGNSKSVLQKTFLNICDLSLSDYIRRRRLSEAIHDIRDGEKIIDVAMNYQYNSADAFTRAFKTQHGITPSEARENDATVTFFPKIRFTFSIKGVEAMNYKIEERKATRIIGYKYFVSMEQAGSNFIPSLWDALSEEQLQNLLEKSNHKIDGIIGINADMYNNGFDYYIAVTSDEPAIDGLDEFVIKESTWLKVHVEGPLRPEPVKLKEAYGNLFKEWLPNSNYEHSGIAEIEYYPDLFKDKTDEDFATEIWVSVNKLKG
jgi:AraC family transcriptional regulator